MSLRQQITADLTAAMKSRDAARTSTLRMVKAALQNREIEKGGALDEGEMIKLLRSMVKQRHDSIEQFEKGGRQDLVEKESEEVKVSASCGQERRRSYGQRSSQSEVGWLGSRPVQLGH